MASSIMGCLEFTWDSPSQPPDSKMPILDTKIWVDIPTRSWDLPEALLPQNAEIPMIPGDLKPNIMYEFYRKEISNKTPMHARSAAPLKQKIATMADEFLRRMTNTSKHLPKAALEAKLTEYANNLKS